MACEVGHPKLSAVSPSLGGGVWRCQLSVASDCTHLHYASLLKTLQCTCSVDS